MCKLVSWTPWGPCCCTVWGLLLINESKNHQGGKGSFKRTALLLSTTSSKSFFSKPLSRGFTNFLYHTSLNNKKELLLLYILNCNWKVPWYIMLLLNFTQRCMPNHWIVYYLWCLAETSNSFLIVFLAHHHHTRHALLR